MKLKNTKSIIIRPLIASLLCFAVGGGLFLYYYFYVKDTSIASYVINGVIIFLGALSLISTIYISINQKMKIEAYNKGVDIMCEYISHNTNVSSAKVNYYFINYSYIVDGKKYERKSSAEFEWVEILAIKSLKTFKAKLYKNKIILNEDLDKYIKENKESIDAQQKLYDDAYKKVENL